MPPSSRKRNKGKDRKAKQLAKKEENERAESLQFWWSFCSSITQCSHGYAAMADDSLSNFITQFIINIRYKGMTVGRSLTNLFETHRHIWNDKSYRRLAISILMNVGTNMLMSNLLSNGENIDICWSVYIAKFIAVLEQYDDVDNIGIVINKPVVLSKWRDLERNASSIRRDALKFYRKRISACKCLKKMHLEARKTPKMGMCHNCAKEMDRVSLSVCSKCKLRQFCSRECQVADWPSHKEVCARVSSNNKPQ